MLKNLFLISSFLPIYFFSQTSKVNLTFQNSQWDLIVNNQVYYIKGAGGTVKMKELKAAGGNTIRTWGLENAQAILDEAQQLGLKVMLGFWVQHERHGFDYNDEEKVKNQLEGFRQAVRKYKNHPALLMWGIGNEYELEYSNTKVWAAVNDIARMVHEEDKNHPTSTVTAGTNSEKLKFMKEVMTEIDIYGINTYGDIENVKKILSDGEFNKPYMITEWGPNGWWESPKTKWGASIEQSSSEKAEVFLSRYKRCIDAERKQCVGSFAFLWGQKQEHTSTWFGLFTENGLPTEALDVLEFCWSGNYPKNSSPSIVGIKLETKDSSALINSKVFPPKEKITFSLSASDKNKDELTYLWELYPESTDLKSGGDVEAKPPSIPGKISGNGKDKITLKTPMKEGKYRLFVSVTDGEKVAYTNIPFYVQNDPNSLQKTIKFKEQTLKSFEDE